MNQVLHQNSLMEALAAAIGPHLKHDSPSGNPSYPYLHGPGGLFSGPAGLDRSLISTRVQPIGIADIIPARGTNYMNPLFGFITGFGEGVGEEKDGVCDDPPVGGPIQMCKTVAAFGRFERRTRELEVNRLGQLNDRSELLDLRLVNPPLLEGTNSMTTPNVPGGFEINNDVRMRMLELGVSFQNLIAPKLFSGNPANNTPGGGYKEFPGLDILIGTGKKDAETGVACPTLDSKIVDFNYKTVDDQNADLVNLVTYLMRYLRTVADSTNMSPVRWVLAMRPLAFYEISAVWPCSYLTYRCIERIQGSVTFDAGDANAMRDAMRDGRYLLVDGMRVDVVLDNSIPEESSADSGQIGSTGFASDIYILPMTVRGGDFASLYWEYLDYSTALGQLAAGPLASQWFWSDGGRWLWHFQPPRNWCIQWIAKIEPRIILRTPHLAARILNVQYAPLSGFHEPDPYPTDAYFMNGNGATSRPGPSYYNEWQS